jgi:hypothetical protein
VFGAAGITAEGSSVAADKRQIANRHPYWRRGTSWLGGTSPGHGRADRQMAPENRAESESSHAFHLM